MDYDKKLYNILYELKENLQDNTYYERRPVICNDNVLKMLSKYKPTNIYDLKNINGVGETFVNNYGNIFIEKIREYSLPKKIEAESKELEIMSKLENRLVNINKKNKLLYSRKLSKGYIDLFKYVDYNSFKSFLLNRDSGSFKLVSLDDEKSSSLIKLMKEVKKNENETGNNELFVAYPFVEGKLMNSNLPIKAPLILFPVLLERNAISIVIKNDFDRDIIYNTTLILANNRENKINEVLPDNVIEEFDINDYRNEMLKFYGDYKLYINDSNGTSIKFEENLEEDFNKYTNSFYVKDYLVLGIYSTYATSIYKDFHKLIDNKEINELIRDLINSNSNLNVNNIIEDKEDKNYKTIEDDIYYINELDYSQEKVLTNIKNNKALVVEGPPGTGKSQVITSIIAEMILEGKNVLMVSEKKTALDVIYSRLGNLSKFAMLVDDTKNKESFYNDLSKILENVDEVESYYSNNISIKDDINIERLKINNSTNKLESIASKIYCINDYGISIYNMYKKCKNVDLNNDLETKIYRSMRDINSDECMPDSIYKLKYNELFDLYNYFNNDNILNTLKFFYDNIYNKKYIYNIKQNLNDIELKDLATDINDLKIEIDKYNKLNLFNKLFNRKEINRLIKKINKNYYIKNISKSNIINNIDNIIYIVRNYNFFINSIITFNKSKDIEKLYFRYMYLLTKSFNISLNDANFHIYNNILYHRILKFESENVNIRNDINNFDLIRNEMGKSISKKKELTKILVYKILLSDIKRINDNGKFAKIKEACNRARKMSLNKFMSKYRMEVLDSVKIWLMTPEVVSEVLPLERNTFDVVIFDEASQLYIEKSIPSIYRGKKLVIAGDENQLKPSSLGFGRIDEEDDYEEVYDGFFEYDSLLEASKYKFKSTMLEYHYRSKYEELISFSNYAFYKGKLMVTSDSNRLDEKPIERIKVDGLWINNRNEKEADEVVKLVKKILLTRKNNETIGVITFNIHQMELIEDKLEKEKARDDEFNILLTEEEKRIENGENVGFFVKNIERVQGDERDIIIFSTGYGKNENGRVSVNMGWLNVKGGENRLNVAISRSKKKIYLITSIEPEDLLVENTTNNGPKLFKKYLEYVRALDSGNKDLAKSILNSFGDKETNNQVNIFDSEFEEEVCNKLEDIGYKVDTQYGVGGYRIDLVVKDKDTNENILGIECDGKLYHSSLSARERDYHRQKYLESRGWKIYRIWSPNWWKNPNAEIKKIDNYIKTIKNVKEDNIIK